MTIDELVTIVRFEIENSGLNKLQVLDKLTGKAGKSAEGMGKGFESAEKRLGGTTKATDRLAASFRRVALAASSALSVGSAMRFALNSAGEAKQLNDLSAGLGVNSGELKLWGSAMKMAGRDAGAFYADLAALRKSLNSYSLDEVMGDADYLKRVKDAHGIPTAINEADSMGWSEDTAHWLMQGSDAIQKSLDELRRNGYEVTKEQIENSSALSKAYSALAESLSVTGDKIVANSAPGLTGALDTVTQELTEGKTSIDGSGKQLGDAVAGIVAGATGKIKPVSALPGTAEEEKQGVAKQAFWETLGNSLRASKAIVDWMNPAKSTLDILSAKNPLDAAKALLGINAAGSAMDSIYGLFERQDKISEKLGLGADRQEPQRYELPKPTYHVGQFKVEPPKFPDWKAPKIEPPALPDWKAPADLTMASQTMEKMGRIIRDAFLPLELPGNAGRRSAPTMPEIKHPEQFYKSDLDMMDINRAEVEGAFDYTRERIVPKRLPADAGAAGGGMSNGGVTIQQQTVNVNINGTGLDGQTIARMTAAEVRAAARNADFAPRRR